MSPVYEPDLSYEDMKKAVNTFKCAVCSSQLGIAWSAEQNSYMLRCAKSLEHEDIVRPYEPGPYDIPGFNLFNLKGRRKEMQDQLGEQKTKELLKYEGIISLTKEQATQILETIWPKAPAIEIYKAAIICRQYGLNPLMKHLFLIVFNEGKDNETWATVTGIKATRLIASRTDHFSYLDNTPRMMTQKEQEQILGEVDLNNLWAITKLQDSRGNKAQGYGSWRKAEEPYGTNKGNTKANMVFIRSERQAFDRLFPGEMPQGIEVMDEEYIPPQIEAPKSILPKGKDSPPSPVTRPTAPPKINRLTPAQRNKIWGDASIMGYSEDAIHGIIKQKWGVSSVNDLSIAQASDLITMISRGEGVSSPEPQDLGLERPLHENQDDAN